MFGGCEFLEFFPKPGFINNLNDFDIENDSKEIIDIGYTIDNTSKTRAIFEINKGSNKINEIDVNSKIDEEDRRIPFKNMIYIADGPSDVPVFSLINKNGGKTYAVYKKGSKSEFNQVNELQKQKRIQSFGEAVYTEDSQTAMWLLNSLEEIAKNIVSDKKRGFGEKLGKPPKHLD